MKDYDYGGCYDLKKVLEVSRYRSVLGHNRRASPQFRHGIEQAETALLYCPRRELY